MKEIKLYDQSTPQFFQIYEKKFKALADQKRLHILYELCQRGETCVCDLTDVLELPQSKLSYHLKLLLDANLITKETKGTWSYYDINKKEVDALLSEQLCCIFRPMS
ncbi:ArsR/SmtB family transcription factor [Bacillus zanthoxyli]|uniref:ArsR/SmtB family transcription factor n=1 Tax=Bacillus albus TaxID=2026189 RepID=UPI0018A12BCF|nr:metalloregulator ArsR/SmtB family transcription factor [Bacillus albus]MBF7155420.1 winged helix-turn-helix transcriptional regulator [Bacillus albus]